VVRAGLHSNAAGAAAGPGEGSCGVAGRAAAGAGAGVAGACADEVAVEGAGAVGSVRGKAGSVRVALGSGRAGAGSGRAGAGSGRAGAGSAFEGGGAELGCELAGSLLVGEGGSVRALAGASAGTVVGCPAGRLGWSADPIARTPAISKPGTPATHRANRRGLRDAESTSRAIMLVDALGVGAAGAGAPDRSSGRGRATGASASDGSVSSVFVLDDAVRVDDCPVELVRSDAGVWSASGSAAPISQ
jgi:hypothetical protein